MRFSQFHNTSYLKICYNVLALPKWRAKQQKTKERQNDRHHNEKNRRNQIMDNQYAPYLAFALSNISNDVAAILFASYGIILSIVPIRVFSNHPETHSLNLGISFSVRCGEEKTSYADFCPWRYINQLRTQQMSTKSAKRRTSPLFLRNDVATTGQFDIPKIRKQDLPSGMIDLIGYKQASDNQTDEQKLKCGVHFFEEDDIFAFLEKNPRERIERIGQYAFTLTPDFSVYPEMPLWRQLYAVALSRYVGAIWQQEKLLVIPTVSWSTDKRCFDFCFDGIEQNAPVALSTIGSRKCRSQFLYGYARMREVLRPSMIICYGKPLHEMMTDKIIPVSYKLFKKGGK